MMCFGTCLFLRALWADVSGQVLPIHLRTDANNLVTTAQTTHLPEQKETHHLIQMLRHESNTGNIDDLSHVTSEFCPGVRQEPYEFQGFRLHTVTHGKRIVVTQMDDLQEETAARGSSSRRTPSKSAERRHSGGKGKRDESRNAEG